MSGMFWNSRGLSDPEKKLAIIEAIKDYKLGFVGLQETRKSVYSRVLLESLSGASNFAWFGSPSRGFAGGVLLGINKEMFDILEGDFGFYYVRCLVRHKISGESWNIVSVYGPPHDKDKQVFLIELVHVLHANTLTYVVGGGVNIIRKSSDCNRPRRLSKWSTLFNDVINNKELKELELTGRKYTWSNNQEIPVMAK